MEDAEDDEHQEELERLFTAVDADSDSSESGASEENRKSKTKKNASKKARLHVALRFIIYFADLNEIHALQPQKTRRPRKTSRRRKIKRRPRAKRRRRTRKMNRRTRKRMQRIWLSVQRRPGS